MSVLNSARSTRVRSQTRVILTRKAERKQDRADEAELERHRATTRRTNSELELESLLKQYAMALSFYDRYKERGIVSVAQLQAKLEELKELEKPRSSQVLISLRLPALPVPPRAA
eukprot:7101060-Prymnesium_polylepis.1